MAYQKFLTVLIGASLLLTVLGYAYAQQKSPPTNPTEPINGIPKITPKIEYCEGQIDLSTGSNNNFIAKSAGSIENSTNNPPDWYSKNQTLYAVSTSPWISTPPVNVNAMWITPFTDPTHTKPQGFGDFDAFIDFYAPAPGIIKLYVAADDKTTLTLDSNTIGSHSGFGSFSTFTASVKSGSHTLHAFVDDVGQAITGLLVIGWYCPDKILPEEVIVKNLHFSAEVNNLTILKTPRTQWVLLKEMSCLIQESDAWEADRSGAIKVYVKGVDMDGKQKEATIGCEDQKPVFNAADPMLWLPPASEIKISTNDGGIFEVDLWTQIYGQTYNNHP
ncbi:MAG: hypothetical protein QW416_02680 [Candidatus Nitrosocaldaceae archaeon]